MEILGVDIGGSGIKGALVDTEKGVLLTPRYRLPTPESAKPEPVAEVVAQIARHFGWEGRLGCGFPSPILGGVAMTAANVHKSWIGRNVAGLLGEASGCQTFVINDADAAGLAEMTFGAGVGRRGVTMMITIGTGLGSALFIDEYLVTNTELGHLELMGGDAEKFASDAARKREGLSWKKWAQRLDIYLHTLEQLFWPGMFILGGGVIKDHEKFFPYLSVHAEIVPARLLNEAGIVGAAIAAERGL